MLKNEGLVDALHVVEVGDTELLLRYEDKRFAGILETGRYAFWKGMIDYRFDRYDTSDLAIPAHFPHHLLTHDAMLLRQRVFTVSPYETALLYVNGLFSKQLDPGEYHFWSNNMPLSVSKVDLRQQQLEVAGQEVLTSDKAALRINMDLVYAVTDVMTALTKHKDYTRQLYTLAQLALREYIGALGLDELLEKKAEAGKVMLDILKPQAVKLGLELRACGVRDIILPGDVKDIMNKVLIAQKNAQANVITRREETASTRSLLNTAKLMEDNDMLYKLKEMEYVEKIAEKINNISVSGSDQIVDQLKTIFAK